MNKTISIEDWLTLSRSGIDVPCEIMLDGVSMQPLIRKNKDRVTIIPLRREVKLGDIVLFRDPLIEGRYVCHRVYRIRKGTETQVVTLGDNCYAPDRAMNLDQILGLVVKVVRDGTAIPVDTDRARLRGRIRSELRPVRNFYRRMRSLAGRVFRKFFPKK